MWRCCLVLAFACGRIGFDASTGDSGTPDMLAPRCDGPGLATLPATTGGGIQLVRAFGPAPNAPATTPFRAVVDLAWEPRNLTAGAIYAVVRGECGSLDASTIEPCTETSTGSCRVCTSPTPACSDFTPPPSPARVRYSIVVVSSSGAVQSLADDARFIVDVAVPPSNMVLVHRASANREMCNLLNTPSDADAHHRCAYSGPGGAPHRAHPDSADLNLPAGFYDFGYDLFVDRWETACNWTLTGSSEPSTPGAIGDVYYATLHGRCYVMT